MKKIIKTLFYYLSILRYVPVLMLFYVHPKRSRLKSERNIWIKIIKNGDKYSFNKFIFILKLPEYRSLLYYRMGGISKLVSWIASGQICLYLETSKIGNGLVIQHGYSTIINCRSIGENCQIWHNVTIGTNKSHSGNLAEIGNNVKICTGAIVIGDIRIGNNVTIGAGCVVTKNVPDNSTVVGNPAYLISFNGEKVYQKL